MCSLASSHIPGISSDLKQSQQSALFSDPIAAIFSVCQAGNFAQVKASIIQDRSMLSQCDHQGHTLFHICAATHQLANMQWLFEQDSSVLEQLTSDGRSSMHIAVEQGDLEIVVWLDQKNKQLIQTQDKNKLTPLHLAAFHEHIAICERFIDQIKANPTLIQQIAQQKCSKTLALLLERKVNPNTMNSYGQTLLHLAAEAGQESNVMCLIQHGAQIDAQDQLKRSPLFLAVTQGHRATIQTLIKLQANLTLVNEEKETLLHVAAFYGRNQILQDLLNCPLCKSLINAQDNDGKTPLHKAVWGKSKFATVRVLLANGANPQSQNKYGYTPLHWAAKHGHCQSAKLLGYAGKDVSNANNHYPFDLAIRFGQDNFIHSILGTQTRLKIDPPSSREDIEGFYFKCLREAKKQGLVEEQILYLFKLSALFIDKAERAENNTDQLLLIGAKILNGAIRLLGEKHPLFKKYAFKRLEEIEKLFLKTQGVKVEIKDNTIEEMRFNLSEVRKAAAVSHQQGKPIEEILQQLTFDFKAILSQLIAQTQEVVGPAPVKWACIGMGSMSREEMCPYSDVEFAFLLAKDSPKAFEYFRTLSKILELKIINLGETRFPVFGEAYDSPTPDGFCLDSGGNTPLGVKGIYELIGTPEQLAQFQSVRWMERNIILPNAMSNVCLIAGSKELEASYNKHKQKVQQLKETKQKNVEELALRLLSGHLMEFIPDLSKEKERETAFGVKKELYRPFQEILGCLALLYDLKEKSTMRRIDELVKLGVFSSQGAQNLKKVISKVLSLRLQTHLFYQDEKEFLCHSEEGKSQDPTLYYFNEEHIRDLQEIYRTLFPFHQCSSDFFKTRDTKSLNSNSFYDDSPLLRGNAYAKTLQYKQAQAAYQEAVSLNPNNVEALLALGNIEGTIGDASEQLKRSQKALELAKKTKSEPSHLVSAYNKTAEAFNTLGQYQEALKHLEQGWKIAVESFGEEHPETIKTYATVGYILRALGDYKKSLEHNKKALLLAEKIFGKESEQTAQIYDYVGASLSSLGKYPQSLKYYQKALTIYKKTASKEQPLGSAYNSMGDVLSTLGQYKKAEKYYRKHLRNIHKIFGSDHPEIAHTYIRLGSTAGSQGDVTTALKNFEKALAFFHRLYGERHPIIVTCYNSIGSAFSKFGNYQKCIEFYQKGLEVAISVFGDRHPNIVACYSNIGSGFDHLANYQVSLENYHKALEIALDVYRKDHPQVAAVYKLVGNTLSQLGSHYHAMQNLEKALEINRKVYGENHPMISMDYNDISVAYQRQGDFLKGLEMNQKALAIGEKTLRDPDLIYIYNNWGAALGNQFQYKEAAEIIEKALKICLKTYGDQYDLTAQCYHNIGSSYCKIEGEFNKGIEYIEKALNIWETIYPDGHPKMIPSHINVLSVLTSLGKVQEAIVHQQKVINLQLKQIEKQNVDASTGHSDLSQYDQIKKLEKIKPLKKTLRLKMSLTPWLDEGDPNHRYTTLKVTNPQGLWNIETGLEAMGILHRNEYLELSGYYSILGGLYCKNGEYEKAIDSHQKALEIREKFHGSEHSEVADSYNSIGLVLAAAGNYEKAIENYEKALAIVKKLNPSFFIQPYSNNIGMAYREAGEYEKAYEILSQTWGEDHAIPQELKRVMDQGGVPYFISQLDQQGQLFSMLYPEQAIGFFSKALRLRKKIQEGNSPELIKNYDHLASLYQRINKPHEAVKFYKMALDIRLQLLGEKHVEVAMNYHNIAFAYNDLCECKKSLKWFQKTLNLQLELFGENHPFVLDTYNHVGYWLIINEQYPEALKYHERALEYRLKIWGNIPNPEVATTYSRMGIIFNELGEYTKGLEYHQKALEIRLKAYGEESHLAVAKSYCLMGMSFHGLKEFEKSIEYHQKSLKIREDFHQTDKDNRNHSEEELAESYEGLAMTLQSMRKDTEAQQYFNKALTLMQKIYPKDYPQRVALENHLAVSEKLIQQPYHKELEEEV